MTSNASEINLFEDKPKKKDHSWETVLMHVLFLICEIWDKLFWLESEMTRYGPNF